MQANCTKCKKDITNLINLYFEGKIESPKCNCMKSEILATIDELNQYLLGHVSTRSLVKSLTELQLLLCEVETKFHEK